MSWKASEHMTATDHRAVLASWGIAPPPGSTKPTLKELVEKVYADIMTNPPPQRPYREGAVAFYGAFPTASSSVARGTDEPKSALQIVFTDESDDVLPPPAAAEVVSSNESEHNAIWNLKDHIVNVLYDASASAAAATPGEGSQSAACAAAPEVFVPSLRRALLLEEAATAKAESNLTAKAKTTKPKGKSKKIYGYLPMAGLFIDEDLKKKGPDDKNDPGDIVV